MADGTVNDLLQFIMQQNMGKISDYVLIIEAAILDSLHGKKPSK